MGSRVVLHGSLGFVAGIFLASFFLSIPFALMVAVVGVFLLSLWQRRGKARIAGLLLVFAGLGMLRFADVVSSVPEPLEAPKEVSFAGTVVKEPEPQEGFVKLVVQPEESSGRVLVFAPAFGEYRARDFVSVTGELAAPPVFEDFDYRAFLAKDKIFWTMWQPAIEVEEQGSSFLSSLRERFRGTINQNLPAPESFVLSSILLGDKSRLPEEFKEQLNGTGTRHITAISGMHVAIFTGLLSFFLVGAGFHKRHAFAATLLFVLFFIALTGFQTSAIRAGVMGGTLLVGGVLGRQSHSLRLLVIAAALMLAVNPLLLSLDAGFQLSFLAVLGILVFAPPFHKVLETRFQAVPEVFGLRKVLAMTLAAQLFTLPVLLSTFGLFSLISVATNVLVVPLLPLVLALGALFLLSALVLPLLSFLFVLPVALLLSFVVTVIEMFSAFPYAALSVQGWFWWILLLLAPAAFFAWRWQQYKAFPFKEP